VVVIIVVLLFVVALTTIAGLGFVANRWLIGERATEREIGDVLLHPDKDMAFSPDGNTLALPKTLDGSVDLFDIGTGKIEILPSPFGGEQAHADHVAYSNDGRLLAVYYRARGIKLWDLSGKSQFLHISMSPREYVVDIVFTKDSQTLVAVLGGRRDDKEQSTAFTSDYWSARWDVSTGKSLGIVVFERAFSFEALSPDGRWAVMQCNRTRKGKFPVQGDELGQDLYDLTSRDKLCAVDGGGDYIFSPDSLTLAAYRGDRLSVWDIPSGKLRKSFVFTHIDPGCIGNGIIGLSPDKKALAVPFVECGQVALLSLESGKVLESVWCCPRSISCQSVRFSPDGRMLVTTTSTVNHNDAPVDPMLRFWKVPGLARVRIGRP
jgi:WD40 repeat protein